MGESVRHRRSGGRSAKRAARRPSAVTFHPVIERKIPYYELLDAGSLQLIEYNADTVLEEIGIDFKEFPQALKLFAAAGAAVDGERVRFPRNMCRSIIQVSAPAEYTQHARNPDRSVIIGGKRTVMVPAYGSPFILAGAMSPVTVAGTVTQILAEALAGMAYIQLVKPGAPVVFGTFGSVISMQSGAPTFGTPEPSLILYAAASLARRLGLPFRSGGGLCGSKIPDAQAAYEPANTLQTAALAGVNFMLHTAGWLEGGLVMGYEKFIMDADQANMLSVLLGGIDLSDNGLAMDALREVGPGSHFLGAAHTQENFETAFCTSTVADNNSYEQWEVEGSLDTTQRANKIWKSMLDEYQLPELDPSIDNTFYATPQSGICGSGLLDE